MKKKFHRKEVIAALQRAFAVMARADERSLSRIRQEAIKQGRPSDTSNVEPQLIRARMTIVAIFAGELNIAAEEVFGHPRTERTSGVPEGTPLPTHGDGDAQGSQD